MNTDDTHFSDNIWERAYRELGYANSDFTDKHTGATDFMYDVNGNMVRDENKGMSLAYNHLDCITRVSFDSGAEIQYLYDGLGTKLRKTAIANDGTVNTTHYLGVYIYDDDGLAFITGSEGRYMPHDGTDLFLTEYQLRDHLGSMRLAFSDFNEDHIIDSENEILQMENYYPFGMKHEGILTPQVGPENLYNYTGKEDQMDFGFAMIDFGARMMDAPLERWFGVDALARNYSSQSPYNYVMGNPISLIDPDGREVMGPHYDSFMDGVAEDVSTQGDQNWNSGFVAKEDPVLKELHENWKKGEKVYKSFQQYQSSGKALDDVMNINSSTSPSDVLNSMNNLYGTVKGLLPASVTFSAFLAQYQVVLPAVEKGLEIIQQGLQRLDLRANSFDNDTRIYHPGAWPGGYDMYNVLSDLSSGEFRVNVDEVPSSIVEFYKENKTLIEWGLGYKLNVKKNTFLGVDSLYPDTNTDVPLIPALFSGNLEQIQSIIYGPLRVD